MNFKLYEATCKLLINYFNIDTDEQTLRKTKYIHFLNENLRKHTIMNNDFNTVNKALCAYIQLNNLNNLPNHINNLDIISKNKIIKLLSSKFYISIPEIFDQLNNIFINIPENNANNDVNNEINYPLFYDIINMFIE